MAEYNPETYWSRVAQEIEKRGENYIAGDDNPYYRYKRKKFLRKLLDANDFRSKAILEVGFGPGGNLKHIAAQHSPRKLFGADVSRNMLEIAAQNLREYNFVELSKIDGVHLPYPDQSMDTSYTVTVLQHNTLEKTFKGLVQELCRVTKTTIVLMEDTGWNQNIGGEGSWIGRHVDVYKSVLAECGFRLQQHQFLNTKISRWWYKQIFRVYRRFIAEDHKEGDPVGVVLKFLIGLAIPVTRILDEIFVDEEDLARMVFVRA